MGACCSKEIPAPLTDEEKALRRSRMAEAAENRTKSFKQGGGGENLKAKADKLEAARAKNAELERSNLGSNGLNDPRAWD